MLAETCKHKHTHIIRQITMSIEVKTFPTRLPEIDADLNPGVISFRCMECGTDIVCDANKAPEWLRSLIKDISIELNLVD